MSILVGRTADPIRPGRTVCYIVGASRAVVQDAITLCMLEAEDAPLGMATFRHPYLGKDGRWHSDGEIIIPEQVPA